MCGRYVFKAEEQEIKREFEAAPEKTQGELENQILAPRYNIAPSQPVAAVRQFEQKRVLSSLKWGLVPSWAKEESIGNRMINARAETLLEKPSFRNAFAQRRCIIPASGFFEWGRAGDKSGKQPFYFYLTDKPVFGFAGLWETWTDKETGKRVESCAIITTEANAVLEPVHDRMPVILRAENYVEWLDPQNTDAAALQKLLAPYPAEEMSSHAVSRKVNNPVFDSSELIEKLDS